MRKVCMHGLVINKCLECARALYIWHKLETVATYVDNSGHDYDIECECTECQKITVAEHEIQMYVLGEPIVCPVKVDLGDLVEEKSWRVEHMWETFNEGSVAEWAFSGYTEDEVVTAAYDRKEKLRPTKEEWVSVEDKFFLYKKGKFLGEFSL